MEFVKGPFEVHIMVNPRADYVQLIDFVYQMNKKIKSSPMKLAFTVEKPHAGENNYMITKWTSDLSINAIHWAISCAETMRAAGLTVVRTKVEALASSSGVPRSSSACAQYISDTKLCKYLGSEIVNCLSPYFEFHVKIDDYNDLAALEDLGLVSFNLAGSRKPLITMRTFDFDSVDEVKKRWIYQMSDYKIISCQSEFTIYDDKVPIN